MGVVVGTVPRFLAKPLPSAARAKISGHVGASLAEVSVEQYRGAKQVYFRYYGSRFAMDRDGPIDENVVTFDSYGVPDEVFRAWDEELIAGHLARLDQPANWHVISFLMLRGFGSYLTQLTAQPPLGRPRDKLIYLECLLRYADHCSDDRTVLRYRDAHYEPQHLWHALDQGLLWARPLLRTSRAAESTRRVRGVIGGADQRLGACEDSTGRRVALWRWDAPTASATPVPIGS
jgi:hypothetical protein